MSFNPDEFFRYQCLHVIDSKKSDPQQMTDTQIEREIDELENGATANKDKET